MATLLDEYGSPVEVPDEAVPALLQQGYQVEAPEATAARAEVAQYGTLTEAAKHVVERGASGLTMGGSDLLAAEVGGDDYRAARERRERLFPGIGMASEAAGALAPLLASGGTSAAARGVALAGSPVRGAAALGRVAETGAGLGLKALGVTGESIAGRAFLRGTQLAAGGTVEGALYGAGHALSESALAPGGDYDHLAERVWAGAKGGALFGALTGGALGSLGGGLGAVGKRLSRGTTAEHISAESAVQALDPSKKAARELVNTKRLHDVGQELLDRDIVKAFRSDDDMLARATQVRQESGDQIGALLKMADDTGVRPDASTLFKRIDDVIETRGGVLSGKHRAVAEQLSSEIAPLREAAESGALNFEQLHRARRAFDESINWAKNERSAAQDDLIKIRGIIEDELERNAEKALPGAFRNEYQAAKKAYGASRWAEKQLTDNLARGQANRMLGLSENIWGGGGLMAGALTGSLGIGALTGLATTLGHKVVRTYGHGVVATLLSNVVRAEKRMDQSVRRFFRTANDVRRGVLGEGSAELGDRDNKVSRALRQRANETRVQAYQRRMQDLAKYQADPVAYLQGKVGKAGAHMPETSMALAGMITRGNAYLAREAPGMPDERVVFGPARKPNPDPVSLARFTRKAQVVDDPMSVLDELEGRTLTMDHVKALREVYPRLFSDIQSRVTDELAEQSEKGNRLPYSDQVMIGTLLQIPTVPSLLPEHIAVSQAALKTPTAQPTAPARAPAKRSASTHMTKLEKIEAEGVDL